MGIETMINEIPNLILSFLYARYMGIETLVNDTSYSFIFVLVRSLYGY